MRLEEVRQELKETMAESYSHTCTHGELSGTSLICYQATQNEFKCRRCGTLFYPLREIAMTINRLNDDNLEDSRVRTYCPPPKKK